MSGVYIHGMEMPTNCCSCPCASGNYCGVTMYAPTFEEWYETGAKKCPLVPVPPHGDLIDKNVLVNKIGENIDKAKERNYEWWYACTVAYDFALAAPTIIPADPAEEGE